MSNGNSPEWFTYIEGTQHGPYTWRSLLQWKNESRLADDVLVWKEGLQEWKPLREVISSSTPKPTSPLQNVTLPTAPVSNAVEPKQSDSPAPTRTDEKLETKHEPRSLDTALRSKLLPILLGASSLLGCCMGAIALVVVLKEGAADERTKVADVWQSQSTGLMWQKTPAVGLFEWEAAREYCDKLDWAGFSDWRLPNISELRTLIEGCEFTEPDGVCGVSHFCRNDACKGPKDYKIRCMCEEGTRCYSVPGLKEQCPSNADQKSWFWSTSRDADSNILIWTTNFRNGSIGRAGTEAEGKVRCVRGAFTWQW